MKIPKVQKNANLVDLEKWYKMSIWLQKSQFQHICFPLIAVLHFRIFAFHVKRAFLVVYSSAGQPRSFRSAPFKRMCGQTRLTTFDLLLEFRAVHLVDLKINQTSDC